MLLTRHPWSAILSNMKLSEWARKNGLSYRTAWRLFKAGSLPCHSEQLKTGTILVHPEEARATKVVLYGRVSSHDQKEDLTRQIQRLRDYCASQGWPIADEATEIGSGLIGRRKVLLRLLGDPSVSHIVVEHRDRLTRFGSEMIEATLSAAHRELVVVNETECKDDLVQDFIDVVTSMCARIYGRRSAKNRARRALEAAGEDS